MDALPQTVCANSLPKASSRWLAKISHNAHTNPIQVDQREIWRWAVERVETGLDSPYHSTAGEFCAGTETLKLLKQIGCVSGGNGEIRAAKAPKDREIYSNDLTVSIKQGPT